MEKFEKTDYKWLTFENNSSQYLGDLKTVSN